MPIKLNGSTSGSVTVQAPAVAGTNTLTLPAATGNLISSADTGTVTQTMLGTNVAGNGPAFSVYPSASQTVTNATYTKAVLNTKEFDTNNNFDSVTNYRFTPTVAGYYQFNWGFYAYGSVNTQQAIAALYKNGSAIKYGSSLQYTAGYSNYLSTGSALVSMNGTTDYVEIYFYCSGSGTLTFSSGSAGSFSGFLARSA